MAAEEKGVGMLWQDFSGIILWRTRARTLTTPTVRSWCRLRRSPPRSSTSTRIQRRRAGANEEKVRKKKVTVRTPLLRRAANHRVVVVAVSMFVAAATPMAAAATAATEATLKLWLITAMREETSLTRLMPATVVKANTASTLITLSQRWGTH